MVVTFQLGKSEIDENFIETIRASFKRQDVIKIKVLETYSRDRAKIREAAELISSKLETETRKFLVKIIGFTIILQKRRKSK